MTEPEDLVRSTVRAIAETVREVPPLRLSPAPAPGDLTPPAPSARRLRSWLAPAAAAAAVLALAASLVAVQALRAAPDVPRVADRVADRVPAYYVAPERACRACTSTRLVVANTFTGATVATVAPPRGATFEAVSAAADDRTFVADTVGYPFSAARQRVTWYRLTITPGAAQPARLTRLRIPSLPSPSLVGTIALSPSGSELAVTYQVGPSGSPAAELRIYSVATGKLLNSWSDTSGDGVLSPFSFVPYAASNNLLDWVDGGRAVSFTVVSYAHDRRRMRLTRDVAVRAVIVAAPGGELIGDSRVIWSAHYPEGSPSCGYGFNAPRLSADGATVVCAESDTLGAGDPSGKRQACPLVWLAYQTSTPKAARTLYTSTAYTTGAHQACLATMQWADPAGSTLIVAWSATSESFSAKRFGLISDGKFSPLPTPPGITVASPPEAAW